MGSEGIFFGNVFEVLLPLEKLAPNKHLNSNFVIGAAKENDKNETRVGLTPDVVSLLTCEGFRVIVENDAGKSAGYENTAYADAGAEIIYSAQEVFQADMLFKIQPPTLEEIDWMKNGATLFSTLPLSYCQAAEYFSKLTRKKITAFSYDHLKDELGKNSFSEAMGEIAGRMLFNIVSDCLCRQRGTLPGSFAGIPATRVVILGAGNVALHVAKLLACSGCSLEVFDSSIHRLGKIQQMAGHTISTALLQNGRLLEQSIANADVVIAAIHSSENSSPCVISEEMVKRMKDKTILIDVSINQGGCAETSAPTTLNKPAFLKYGVTHYCLPCIPALVPNTASHALGNVLTPLLLNFCDTGNVNTLLQLFHHLRTGVYCYRGILTDRRIAARFGLKYQDINLLLEPRLG